MPWTKLKNVPATVRKHKGVPLTLAQANWASRIAAKGIVFCAD